MARKNVPIFKRDGIYYGRWLEHASIKGKHVKPAKKIILSLDTSDPEIALVRFPVVRLHGVSWLEYARTRDLHAPKGHWPSLELKKIDSTLLPYPKSYSVTNDESLEGMINRAIETGKPSTITLTDGRGFIIQPLIADKENNLAAIKDFFNNDTPILFLDKTQAARNTKIWLQFIEEKKISSWVEIDENLISQFYEYRLNTPQKPEGWGRREATKPSNRTVNRHLKWLKKCLTLAIRKNYIKNGNPLDLWKYKGHTARRQQALTEKELITVLSDRALDQDNFNPKGEPVKLGYTLRDVIVLLFVSCKRRGEVANLKISDINYTEKYVHYVETKNSSKGNSYNIHKAFYLTDEMCRFLKRVTKGKKDGLIFPSPWDVSKPVNPEKISLVFSQVVKRLFPDKNLSLKNLRQSCTSLAEKAGLTDQAQDALLGHIQTKTSIRNYQDQSDEAIARRLSKMTEPGIKVMSEIVKEFLK